MRRLILTTIVVLLFSVISFSSAQETTIKPLSLPLATAPGPSTWLLGQLYGNTTGAFNNAQRWYAAGQGLHFGIDISMPCGTELVAMADGVVAYVDNLGFGSAPHNLLIRHDEPGLLVLYGHLLQTPALVRGQSVQKGQVVALSGDPDVVCDSRPHLHLEVRSLDGYTAYNPIDYIEADWHSLALLGSFSNTMFQQDLTNTRRWMSLDDQPAVTFGGVQLNAYTTTWPLPGNQRPPGNPLLRRETVAYPETARWSLRQLGYPGCCAGAWWNPADPERLYVIDGSPGQRADIVEWLVNSGPTLIMGHAPPPFRSADGTHELYFSAPGQVMLRRLSDGAAWPAPTNGELPSLSADNSRLMWTVRSGINVPGQPDPQVTVYVSNIDGSNARQILSQSGGSAVWLDEARLLITSPLEEDRNVTLSVFDTRDDSSFTMGTWNWLRGLNVSPGGERVMFYLTWNPDSAANGIYTIATVPGAQAKKVPWFGGWRWRDSESVFYAPLGERRLLYYNLITDEQRALTTEPIRIANGDWSVSPDGRRIVYLNADDLTMWLLEQVE